MFHLFRLLPGSQGARPAKAIALAGALLLLLESASLAGVGKAQSPPRIILLETFGVPVVLDHTKYFLDAMKTLGYDRARIPLLRAEGSPVRAEQLLREEIARARPDVIVANATLAAEVAFRLAKAKNIPMVFMTVSDPVGAGIIPSIGAPTKTNVTGIIHSVPRDTKVEMVMRILAPLQKKGRPFRFGFIHSSYPSAVGDLALLRAVAKRRSDLEFAPYQIPYDEKSFRIQTMVASLVPGIAALEPKIDYWWIAHDPVGELPEFVQTLVKHSKHPVVCGTNLANTQAGALVHIMADTETGAREAAAMVDLILKGVKPGTIPPRSPSKIDFGVNLSTAKRMGIAIPSDLLELAGTKVFR